MTAQPHASAPRKTPRKRGTGTTRPARKAPKAPNGLLIGYPKPQEVAEFGFGTPNKAPPPPPAAAVSYDDEGHLLTIAPTGAGKGVGCVVPAILRHDGPVFVMDLKGENYAMTRRHRRDIGSKVQCIDPFGIAKRITDNRGDAADDEIAGFNPFDLLPFLSDDRDTACRALAELILPPDGTATDPFWRQSAVGILAALIDHYEGFEGPMRSLTAIINDLGVDVPDAQVPGDIDLGDDAESHVLADPNLMDALDEAGISFEDAWQAFEATGLARKRPIGRVEAARLIMRAAALGAERASRSIAEAERLGPEGIDNMMQEIGDELLGDGGAMTLFAHHLAEFSSSEHHDANLTMRLWDLFCGLRDRHLAQDAYGGGFPHGHPGVMPPMPENYVLAMHRIARSPSPLCRSAAGQPMTADKTWGSILCVLRSGLAEFSGRSVARTLSGATTVDLNALRRNEDISLYLAFPPARMRSHAALFRLIVEGLLTVLTSRTGRPAKRMLFLLDEVAQLGRIDLLVTAKTLLRGYGVQVWSFWQDISQLKTNYPKDWPTILNNCRVIQVFGKGTGIMTSDLSAALDVGPDRIASLPPEHLLAWVDGAPPVVLRRPTCYADPDLKELCDPGPFFDPDFVEEDIKPFPRRGGSEGDGGAEPDLMSALFGANTDVDEDEIELFTPTSTTG